MQLISLDLHKMYRFVVRKNTNLSFCLAQGYNEAATSSTHLDMVWKLACLDIIRTDSQAFSGTKSL